ncbi:hypothetical protein ABPG75_000893 [Micractinium tetrahymenae]
MGQQPAKPSSPSPEQDRLDELDVLIAQADRRLERLLAPACAEQAKGIPATPGSKQAQYDAAFEHFGQLLDERTAICARLASLFTADPLPMPDPTPPFCPPPSAPVEAPDSAALPPGSTSGVDPGTPTGGASSQGAKRGSSSGGSSGEEAALAGGADRLESAPLLRGEARQLAPGLRRRQGHEGFEAS